MDNAVPKQPPDKASRLVRPLERFLGVAVAAALVLMIGIVFANVVGRYAFGYSLTWGNEAAIWLFVALIFLGMPLTFLTRNHIALDVLVRRLPSRARTLCHGLSDLILVTTILMLMTGSVRLIELVGGTNYALGLPGWLKFAVIPFSCAIVLLFAGLGPGGSVRRKAVALCGGVALFAALEAAQPFGLPAMNPVATMVFTFAAVLLLGVPVAFGMVFSVFVAAALGGPLPAAAVVQNMVNGTSKFLLLAIPFFVTAGTLMNAGGLTERLMTFAFTLVGHFRGGLAQVNVVTSGLFAGVSGSSYSEAALGAKMFVPHMVSRGYPAAFSCAVTAASATLPNVIPPSIALLILASAANLSVGSLWLAGIGPGLVMTACLMGSVYILARRRGYGADAGRATRGERSKAFAGALPVLFLAVAIIVCIRGGVVTPTEAGVVAAVYALFVGTLIYRRIDRRTLWKSFNDAARDTAMIGLLIGAAAPFTFVLVTGEVPQQLAAFVSGLSDNPLVLLILANLILLFFGMFLDIGAGILILTPLLMPVMTAAGVDPVHFGLVVVVNLMIGGLTPPIGMLTFVASAVTKTPVNQVYRSAWPMLAALLAALVLVTYVPPLSLGLEWIIG